MQQGIICLFLCGNARKKQMKIELFATITTEHSGLQDRNISARAPLGRIARAKKRSNNNSGKQSGRPRKKVNIARGSDYTFYGIKVALLDPSKPPVTVTHCTSRVLSHIIYLALTRHDIHKEFYLPREDLARKIYCTVKTVSSVNRFLIDTGLASIRLGFSLGVGAGKRSYITLYWDQLRRVFGDERIDDIIKEGQDRIQARLEERDPLSKAPYLLYPSLFGIKS